MKQDGELTPFDFALLVLCGGEHDRGASPYQIELLMQDSPGGVLGFSKSHAYRELKRLAETGYLNSHTTGTSTRSAIQYVLTQKGLDTARAWVSSPGVVPPIHGGELFIRLRALRFVRPGSVRRGLEPIRVGLEGQLYEIRHRWRSKKSVDVYERLEFQLFECLLGAYLNWFEILDNELGLYEGP